MTDLHFPPKDITMTAQKRFVNSSDFKMKPRYDDSHWRLITLLHTQEHPHAVSFEMSWLEHQALQADDAAELDFESLTYQSGFEKAAG